ncbi:MAG: LacI family transcriptional regulator [Lactobacillus sp.]|uniref:LacI family DNA-binding transcriptional regulator n=1 Tax=Limosilactobacillus coleohominis TaxID=181675 RepID=UPI002A91EBA4|nr:LacI family DNA-binding transcriptional regulator [Limosilactobacillus coleohominis]MCI5812508.1 LacI family transcriptional regulator [Lactobacillus sp.]MDY5628206.1 LacI family DNA-binding transcriptional regulator [Limosilactobacillus coleohominis]
MKRTTISQVAKEAGVSVTTVSRYLNGKYSKMGSETKQKIADTIKRLNYIPTASARRLRQGQSHVIGVLVGDIGNTFSTLLAKGIDDVLHPAGYDIVLMNTNNSTIIEKRALQRLYELQADGIIVQPDAIHFEQFADCINREIPLVLVDREVMDQPATVGRVTSANQDACYRLGQELHQKNYDHILTVSAHFAEASGQIPRIAGLKATAEDYGLSFHNIETRGRDYEWLKKELLQKINRLPGKTVVISLMGPILFQILDIFKELQITFPKDVGLVSFDDWNWSRYVQDGIYLMRQDMELMGNVAARKLLNQIKYHTVISDTTILPVAMVNKPSI